MKWPIPFTVQYVANVGLGDEVVVALEPVIAMLPDVGCIMTSFNGADVIDHSKQ
jgi:hypothetical protein